MTRDSSELGWEEGRGSKKEKKSQQIDQYKYFPKTAVIFLRWWRLGECESEVGNFQDFDLTYGHIICVIIPFILRFL